MERWLASVIAAGGTIAGLTLCLWLRNNLKRIIVFDYQQGLLYKNGSLQKILSAGSYLTWLPSQSISIVDLRRSVVTISGQEIVTADKVGVKLSILLSYKIADVDKAINKSQSWYQEIYALAQIAVRDEVSKLTVEELMQARSEFGAKLLDGVKAKASEVGVEILMLEVKDLILPAELRKIFAEVLRAQKEGLAALERARGEQAALRSLANAARVLEGNQNLMNLRILHALTGTQAGATPPTVVLSLPNFVSGSGPKESTAPCEPETAG